MTLVLAIETSCDETSVALVNDRFQVVAQKTATQLDHSKYGGVIPEVAARRHYELLPLVFEEVLQQAHTDMDRIDAIAVTRGPGLVGALLVGVSFAKGLAFAYHKPLVGVHHLEGHICAVRLVRPDWPLPALALVVSGGHTHLYYMRAWGAYQLVAKTRDDAIGEAFDKVAKMLGLGYPGGPIIDRLARQGNPTACPFPTPHMRDGSLDFSYSGLKTAVLHRLQTEPDRYRPNPDGSLPQATLDLLAGFQAAAVEQVLDRLQRALDQYPVQTLIVTGGVAANSVLRERVQQLVEPRPLELAIPPIALCTDNAAMIGAAALHHLTQGQVDAVVDLDACATWALETAPAG